MKTRITDPCTAVMAVLRVRFGADGSATTVAGLAAFQSDAVARLRQILEQRGGAILADSVGLGKTHVAKAIIVDALESRAHVLICGPAQLRRHWARHLRGMERWGWLSHTSLSRGTRPRRHYELIVVDEAHAFRNPGSRRYHVLGQISASSRLLLITATPVNNSVADFYHLVRLFARRDSFHDVGVADLLSAAEAATQGDSAAIRRVGEAVVVRRNRYAVDVSATCSGIAARFPQLRGIHTVDYDITSGRPDLLHRLLAGIQRLEFPAYQVSSISPHLLRMGMLKRLESSVDAFDATLSRHLSILLHFRSAAEQHLLFAPGVDSDLLLELQDSTQLSLPQLVLRPWPRHLERQTLLSVAGQAIGELQEMRALLGSAACDDKLKRLRELVDSYLPGGRILIFTEFRRTADYLWRSLAGRFAVALIHGSESRLGLARAARSTVVDRFAPHANRAKCPRPRERIDVLIATDVIAEGMNLQDANVVVSYDLPWNPVRLSQRVGRVDRLGSPHAIVDAYAFRPAAGLEEMLGVIRRIRRKVRQIQIVGGDAPRLLSIRAAPSPVDERHIVVSEKLRAYYRQRQATAATDEIGCPVISATESARTAVALLVCWRTGRAVRFFLSEGAKTVELSLPRADDLLLDILHSTSARTPNRKAVRTAVRQSRVLVRQQQPLTSRSDVTRQLSLLIRRWVRNLPLGATTEQIALADAALGRLHLLGPKDEQEARRLARAGNVEALARRVVDCAATAAPRPPGSIADAELLAVIELRPNARTGTLQKNLVAG